MPLALDEFRSRLVASGLLSDGDTHSVLASLATDEQPLDGESFAALLVQAGKLTPFQVRRLNEGLGKSLVLDKYVVLDELGQGGMGTVYVAEHRRMKRRVALKVLRPDLLASPEAARRFRREVEAIARLDHPNIVSAFDAGDAAGTSFLVMQLVDGQDLSTVVRHSGPLPVERAIDHVLQAARGLVYAHGQGIIHRDIKPSNLLVDRAGVVKVLDLGLATLLAGDSGSDESLTKSHVIVGTPDYMPPEQARGLKQADARSDIYSLGLTLWYLLTGKEAYEAEGVVGKLLAHRTRPVPSLVEARPGVPPQLDAVFRRMAAKLPSDRYQTMQAVVDGLERLQSPPTQDVPEARSDSLSTPPEAPSQATGKDTTPASAARWQRTKRNGLLAFAAVAALAVPILVWRLAPFFATFGSNRTSGDNAITVGSRTAEGKRNGVETESARPETPASLNEPDPSSPRSRDVYQNVADEVLKLGGSLTLIAASQTITANRVDDLPRQAFVVEGIDLSRQNDIDDEALRVLEELPYIGRLNLQRTNIGDETVRRIARMAGLRDLRLESTNFNDESAKLLASNKNLLNLYLGDTRITDAACGELRSLTSLDGLVLDRTEIGDVGLRELAGHPALRLLSVGGDTRVTNAGVAHLRALPSLQVLNLNGTAIDEEAIETLIRFPQLRYIDLTGTKVTAAGAHRLQASLPKATVLHPAVAGPDAEARAGRWLLEQQATISTTDGATLREITASRFLISRVTFPPQNGPAGGAENLAGLRSLIDLSWPNLRNADHEAESIAELDTLIHLRINGDLSDTGVQRLSALSQLRVLYLDNNDKLTGKGLSHVSALKQLRVIGLSRTQTDDAGLDPLSRLPSLSLVNLSHCPKLTSAGLAHLVSAPRLVHLVLIGNQIDDAAVPHLEQMQTLRILKIPQTKVSARGVAQLAAALPKCAIFWDGGAVIPTAKSSPATLAASVRGPDSKSQPGEPRKAWHGWPVTAPAPAIAPFDAAQAKRHQDAWAAYLGVPVLWEGPYGIRCRLIPPGEFLMGSTGQEVRETLQGQTDEQRISMVESSLPQHKVVLNQPFYLGACEITQEQFEALRGRNPSSHSPSGSSQDVVKGLNTAAHPVERIKWSNAVVTCNELSELCGLESCYTGPPDFQLPGNANGFRLPTEAEWEFACRAGSSTSYWWGDSADEKNQYGWIGSDDHPHAVAAFLANPFGLYDMHGNVAEWCQDWWQPYARSRLQELVNPAGPASGAGRVIRGGAFNADYRIPWRAGARVHVPPDRAWINVGMRVAVSAAAVKSLAARQETLPKLIYDDRGVLVRRKAVSKSADPQRRALEAVFRLGGSTFLHSRGGDIFPSWPEEMLDEPFAVHTIDLADCKAVTDENIKELKDIPAIRELDLSNTNVGDEPVQQLSVSRRLRILDLRGTHVTDSLAPKLAASLDLHYLNLSKTHVTDATCRELSKHPLLGSLVLSDTPITDDGLKELAGCQALRTLDLSDNPQITADGLAHLVSLPHLRVLDLSGTALGDDAIDVLDRFSQLRCLKVTGTQMTEEGVRRLQEALPAAVVLHPDLPQSAADARAAEWVKNKQGTLGKRAAGDQTGPFAVDIVRFPAGKGPPNGADKLAGLRCLQVLSWPNLRNADGEAEALAWLEVMYRLELARSGLSDAGLRRLAPLRNVSWLTLEGSKGITDVGFASLTAFDRLEILSLADTRISDEGLKGVGALSTLRTLILNSCPYVTSAGLQQLTKLSNLSTLDLRRTPVDDAAVVHLKQISSLRLLRLPGTNFTAGGVGELHRALPECVILWNGGVVAPETNDQTK